MPPPGRLLVIAALGAACAAVAAARAGTALVVRLPVTDVDAIVSLASHEWERLPRTAIAAAAHPGALVLLTRPDEPTIHNCHECPHRAKWLIQHGVSGARIQVLQLRRPGTYGEAAASLEFARQARLRRLLVITSPYHTRRALATFQHVFAGSGITVGIEPASPASPARPERWWRAPYDRAYVAYEWAAIVYYAFAHGVWSLRDQAG